MVIELGGSIRWTPTMDKAIAAVVAEVLKKCGRGKPRNVILLTRKVLRERFTREQVLQLRTKALRARIDALNEGKTAGMEGFIDLGDDAKQEAAAVTQAPFTPSTNAVPAAPVPSPQNVGKMIAAINGLASQQADTVIVHNALLDELAKWREAIEMQSSVYREMIEHQKALLSQFKNGAHVLNGAHKIKPLDPKLPQAEDRVVGVSRADICKGPSWEVVAKQRPTSHEQEWRRFFEWQFKRWLHKGFARTSVPMFQVFGGIPILRQTQEIFHRLGPEKIVWISTYSKEGEAFALVHKLHPNAGQIVLLVGDLPHPVFKRVREFCEMHNMKWVLSATAEIDLDAVARKLVQLYPLDHAEMVAEMQNYVVSRNGTL